MAHIFEITASPERSMPLNTNGTGEVVFTLTNVTGTPAKGRAVLGPEKSPVLQWLKLIGDAERLIQPKASDTFVVKCNVPPDTKPGSYSFRLDAISVARPDEDSTEGPTIGISFTLAPPPPKPFPWWILVAAAVVLGAVSYGALKLIPGNGVSVPDLSQKNLSDGEGILTAQHLKLGKVENVATDGPKFDLIVSQSPAPPAKVPPGSAIDVQVGVTRDSPVPDLSQKNLADGQILLTAQHLKLGSVNYILSDPSKIDLILKQSPAPPAKVSPDANVDVFVGQALVNVPLLKGSMQAAQKALADAHLDLGDVKTVNSPGVRVPGQVLDSDPPEGKTVTSHTRVTLTVQAGSVTVPDFSGSPLAGALALLGANNLTLGAITGQPFRVIPPFTILPNTVVSWSSRGEIVPVGTAINLSFQGGNLAFDKSVISSISASSAIRMSVRAPTR